MFLLAYFLTTFVLVKMAQIFCSFNSIVYFVGIQTLNGTALIALMLLAIHDMLFYKTLCSTVVEIEAIYRQVRNVIVNFICKIHVGENLIKYKC